MTIRSIAILGVIILTNFSCTNIKNLHSKKETQICKWGDRYSIIDSIGTHYSGYYAQTDCFPGFIEYDNDIKEVDLKIYDRWGNLVFETLDVNENWVCNDSNISNIEKGTYVFNMKYMKNGDSIMMREKYGTIYIYCY